MINLYNVFVHVLYFANLEIHFSPDVANSLFITFFIMWIIECSLSVTFLPYSPCVFHLNELLLILDDAFLSNLNLTINIHRVSQTMSFQHFVHVLTLTVCPFGNFPASHILIFPTFSGLTFVKTIVGMIICILRNVHLLAAYFEYYIFYLIAIGHKFENRQLRL